MSKGTEKEKRIIALAYFHRYGWIAAMMACIAIWPKQMLLIFSVTCLSFSVWSFIGYKKKWRRPLKGCLHFSYAKMLVLKA